MKKIFIVASMVVLLMSCDRGDKKPPTTPRETSYTEEDTKLRVQDENPALDTRSSSDREDFDEDQAVDNEEVDNTGRNVRDRNPNAITPEDQSENAADRTITQNIRKTIIDDSSLSVNAKNIKIITINGVVTLRGVVSNTREKALIAKKAESVSGVKSVKNLLEEKH